MSNWEITVELEDLSWLYRFELCRDFHDAVEKGLTWARQTGARLVRVDVFGAVVPEEVRRRKLT